MKIQVLAVMSLILVGCGNGGDSVTYVVNEDPAVTTLPATECPTAPEDETVIIVHDNSGHAHECKPKKGHCHVE